MCFINITRVIVQIPGYNLLPVYVFFHAICFFFHLTFLRLDLVHSDYFNAMLMLWKTMVLVKYLKRSAVDSSTRPDKLNFFNI